MTEWRDDNFGKNALARPVTVAALLDEISRYDAADAAAAQRQPQSHQTAQLNAGRVRLHVNASPHRPLIDAFID